MMIKIQETWYHIEDSQILIIHDIATSLQDLKWTKQSYKEIKQNQTGSVIQNE